MSSLYLDICCENSQKWKKYFEESNELCSDENWEKMKANFTGPTIKRTLVVGVEKDKHWAEAVAFATMCLEAFIYDYAAHNFSDTYIKKYIDKLDLISKWVIVPKLVLQKDFPRESKAFECLAKLVRWRNKLVHAKSIPMPKDIDRKSMKVIGPMIKEDIQREEYMYRQRLSPFKMVIEVLTELRKLEGDDISTQWWQLENEGYWWEE